MEYLSYWMTGRKVSMKEKSGSRVKARRCTFEMTDHSMSLSQVTMSLTLVASMYAGVYAVCLTGQGGKQNRQGSKTGREERRDMQANGQGKRHL